MGQPQARARRAAPGRGRCPAAGPPRRRLRRHGPGSCGRPAWASRAGRSSRGCSQPYLHGVPGLDPAAHTAGDRDRVETGRHHEVGHRLRAVAGRTDDVDRLAPVELPRREASCPIGISSASGTWPWANSIGSRTSTVTPFCCRATNVSIVISGVGCGIPGVPSRVWGPVVDLYPRGYLPPIQTPPWGIASEPERRGAGPHRGLRGRIERWTDRLADDRGSWSGASTGRAGTRCVRSAPSTRVASMDLPVMPPVRPMLAKSVKGIPDPGEVHRRRDHGAEL